MVVVDGARWWGLKQALQPIRGKHWWVNWEQVEQSVLGECYGWLGRMGLDLSNFVTVVPLPSGYHLLGDWPPPITCRVPSLAVVATMWYLTCGAHEFSTWMAFSALSRTCIRSYSLGQSTRNGLWLDIESTTASRRRYRGSPEYSPAPNLGENFCDTGWTF